MYICKKIKYHSISANTFLKNHEYPSNTALLTHSYLSTYNIRCYLYKYLQVQFKMLGLNQILSVFLNHKFFLSQSEPWILFSIKYLFVETSYSHKNSANFNPPIRHDLID